MDNGVAGDAMGNVPEPAEEGSRKNLGNATIRLHNTVETIVSGNVSNIGTAGPKSVQFTPLTFGKIFTNKMTNYNNN